MRSSVFCQRCKKPTLHETDPRPVNHVLHFLLTFFFCGLWLPIWLLAAFTQSMPGGKIRCTQCGSTPPLTIGKIAGTAFGFVVMLSLCGGGLVFVSGMRQAAREQRAARADDKPKAEPKPREFNPPRFEPKAQEPVAKTEPQPDRAKPVPDADNPGLPQPQEKPEAAEKQSPAKPVVDQEKAATGMLRAGKSLIGDKRAAWLKKVVAKYPGTQAAKDSQAELDGSPH